MVGVLRIFCGAAILAFLALGAASAATSDQTALSTPGDLPTLNDDDGAALRAVLPMAEGGNAAAQSFLGLMYYYGDGVERDFEKASIWFRRSAEQGDAFAQASLGWMYAQGEGIPRDYGSAAKWFRLSADQGNALAQFKLGVLYFQGQGVTQDYAQAQRWFRLSAEQGDAHAQGNLGLMYADGLGVTQDYVRAHMWLSLAATSFAPGERENRDTAIKKRDRIAARMTAAQIVEAERMARAWKPK